MSGWAEAEGLQLLDYRSARFYEGPGAFLRTDSQYAFRVTVRDVSGRLRHGWLAFGGFWSRDARRGLVRAD